MRPCLRCPRLQRDTADMTTGSELKNQFLVAMPSLDDEHFEQTVTFLCEHSDQGALGLVINRPSDLSVANMLGHMNVPCERNLEKDPVFWGGPVQPERGFVLHTVGTTWESTVQVSEHLAITSSRDILEAIGLGNGPEEYLITLGYAGWDAGQLEEELLHNAWLNTPADRQILFSTAPPERWEASLKLLGVDLTVLSGDAGHA